MGEETVVKFRIFSIGQGASGEVFIDGQKVPKVVNVQLDAPVEGKRPTVKITLVPDVIVGELSGAEVTCGPE